MPSYVTPKKNTAYVTYISLPDAVSPMLMKSSPTLAAGDFKVSIDGGALANLATLPTNTPAASKMVKISLSTSEMNGDNITVVCSDQTSPPEWGDFVLNIQTSARQVDDLAFPNTSGRGMDVDASGGVEVGSFQDNAITAAAIATDAITAAKMASDAVTEIQSGLATAANLATVASYIDTEVAAIKAKTDNLPSDPADESLIEVAIAAVAAQITALNNLSAAQVNAEIVDALNVDTYAEPGQGTPTATASLVTKLGFLYKAWRNLKTQTASEMNLYNDAGSVVDQKATVSDDGTTFISEEIVSGP